MSPAYVKETRNPFAFVIVTHAPGCFLPEAQKALFSFSSLTVIRTDVYVEQDDMLYKPCLTVNK